MGLQLTVLTVVGGVGRACCRLDEVPRWAVDADNSRIVCAGPCEALMLAHRFPLRSSGCAKRLLDSVPRLLQHVL